MYVLASVFTKTPIEDLALAYYFGVELTLLRNELNPVFTSFPFHKKFLRLEKTLTQFTANALRRSSDILMAYIFVLAIILGMRRF